MALLKTKALYDLQRRIDQVKDDPLRTKILEAAKDFKTSWVELGRALFTVWRDKSYKRWGYNNFDAYTHREIGIKKQTAMKLLRSYYFLEKEESGFLSAGYKENTSAAIIPTYEAIDVLRQAKSKKEIDEEDYAGIREKIFKDGRDARDVKRELTAIIRQRQELDPQEAWEKKRASTVKRFVTVLKSLRQEIKEAKLVSASILKEAEALINKLESELAK